MFDLDAIQAALRQFGFDGWLLYDFRGSNILAQRVLKMPAGFHGSRRYFYFIPATGTPRKLVHRIETDVLDHLPGERTVYLRWQELEAGVAELVSGCGTVAMEYSPRNGNPYISRVDAGTVELVRSFGCTVASSGDLISMFESVLSQEQLESHLRASDITNAAFTRVWAFIAARIKACGAVQEQEVCDEILKHFEEHGATTYSPPIVGVNANGGNPHYATGTGANTTIREGDFVLVDLWARLKPAGSCYSDLTRTGYVGSEVPARFTEVFNIVAAARDAGIACAVDDAVRNVIERAGYGEFFCHRTGHNLAQEVHGNGTHMDNLETCDQRRILPGTLFTIEPGIYLPEFGVRSEIDVYVHPDGRVEVTGGPVQTEVVPIMKY